MDVLTMGTPARLEDMPNGQCFAFEAGNQVALGIKVAYAQAPDSRVLVLTRGAGQAPSLQGRQEARPRIVYKQATVVVVTGPTPGCLRDGVGNPQPGQVMQFQDDVYLGFLDEHADPSSVSLKTGLINPNRIEGPVAVFGTWQLALQGGGREPRLVFSYPPPQ